jgi:hydrogenase maturation protease
MTQHRVLIAGIGNIFMGDDAFGCEVTQRLMQRRWPDDVKIVDFGIRGLDLAYALMDAHETTILVDATPQGSTPGTVYVMELTPDDAGEASAFLDAHSMHPLNVLRMVRTLGGVPGRILLVGCEPAELGDEWEETMGLSEPVLAAIDIAIQRIETLVSELLQSSREAMGSR